MSGARGNVGPSFVPDECGSIDVLVVPLQLTKTSRRYGALASRIHFLERHFRQGFPQHFPRGLAPDNRLVVNEKGNRLRTK